MVAQNPPASPKQPQNNPENMGEPSGEQVVPLSVRAQAWMRYLQRTLAAMNRDILIRILFMSFTMAISIKLVVLTKQAKYISLFLLFLFQLAELCISIGLIPVPALVVENMEKWLSTCMLTFFLCTWPAMWIMELLFVNIMNGKKPNRTVWFPKDSCSDVDYDQVSLFNSYRKLPHGEQWSFYLWEQNQLICAVLGRFLLSQMAITRDHLAQWLLVQLCNTADILELVQYLHVESIRLNSDVTLSILHLLHCAQLQFCFDNIGENAMGTKSSSLKRPQTPERLESNLHNVAPVEKYGYIRRFSAKETCQSNQETAVDSTAAANATYCAHVEWWRLWLTLSPIILQDMPFLYLRSILLARFIVPNNQLPLYTLKNVLFILLQSFEAARLLHIRCLIE